MGVAGAGGLSVMCERILSKNASVLTLYAAKATPRRPTLLKQSVGSRDSAADVFSLCLNRRGKRGHTYATLAPRSQRGAKRRAISTSPGGAGAAP